ncbi:hypothetical protein H2O77_13880 [Cobetia sp. 4B]|uniref:hypothetical protein n=1 Tax=Cobetia sp. 4B TaxID=2758724 RepID=UPI001C03CDF8|nr:hypothetical protein [Cobetia sp. 4B]MBR9755301.1 hypothetical protein [Gammaproteobacteria bacterium]QWN36323.1 hypothetical protein H2O77_13880 [Cobetia sp. 4B]
MVFSRKKVNNAFLISLSGSTKVFNNLVACFFVMIFGIYLSSMVIYPFLVGDWVYVQSVWDRWQGLNVGVLAFSSSYIIYLSTKYREEKQRKREFEATKAYLSEALSELLDYYEKCAELYLSAWGERDFESEISTPQKYQPIFKDCIRYATPEVGDYIYSLLGKLQVHSSRLEDIKKTMRRGGVQSEAMLFSNFLGTAEVYALTNKLFDFARNENDKVSTKISLREFNSAYYFLGIRPKDIGGSLYGDLWEYTKKIHKL